MKLMLCLQTVPGSVSNQVSFIGPNDDHVETYRRVPDLPHATLKCAATSLNNKIYVIGGTNVKKNQVYDMDYKTWSVQSDWPGTNGEFLACSSLPKVLRGILN